MQRGVMIPSLCSIELLCGGGDGLAIRRNMSFTYVVVGILLSRETMVCTVFVNLG